MPTTRYDNHESGGADFDDDAELKITAYSTIEANLGAAFGTASEFGQSLGVSFEETELIDGALYADLDKQKFKLFSWQDANELSPVDRFDRGETPTAEDADEVITRTYFGNTKTYDLVAARVPEIMDDDGNIAVEATSKVREVSFEDDEFTEWEDLEGDTVPLRDYITWFGASEDNGASVSSAVMAETLTTYGEDAVVDRDDYLNWLRDDSGDNVLRDELQDRRVEFFIVQRESDESDFKYNLPILVDKETGERIQPDNRSEDGGTGNSDAEENEAVQEAEQQDSGTYPEPLAEFISSGRNDLNLSADRAEALLTDMMTDDDSAITKEMVDDHGGVDTIVGEIAS